MKTVFRKKKVQVVSRHTAPDIRKSLADEASILVANRTHSRVNFASPAALLNNAFQFGLADLARAQPYAVIGENFKFLDVHIRLARHHRVHAARVVANHSADGAAAVRRRIGAEGQVVLLGGAAQVVENDSRLHTRNSELWIKLKNLRHVLGEIQHYGDIAALACQRRASAAAKHRRRMLSTNGDRSNYIFGVSGNHYANWDLAIVRAVGGIERPAAIVETYLTAELTAQSGFQFRVGCWGFRHLQVWGWNKDSIQHSTSAFRPRGVVF